MRWLLALFLALGRLATVPATAAEAPTLAALEGEYPAQIRPLLQRYCFDCHSQETAEADIDLAADATPAEVRKHLPAWIKVRAMLDTRQMPPPDAPQPTDAERRRLQGWVRGFLTHEARSQAGDPGPVVLRRLNNAEYAYTIRDLTGVAELDPTHEFPVDGGSGEGFTNTGSGQGMSPALVQKYLDAAKSIAEHAVLTPEGIRFSPQRTQRDQTDELLAMIQAYYRRFTDDGGGTHVDLQGIRFDTNQGGRLPLRRYLAAMMAERTSVRGGAKTIEQVAAERSLSPRYLAMLWWTLETPAGAAGSPLLAPLREAWRNSAEAEPLAAAIEAAQQRLWKYNSIGHIGRAGGPAAWLEPIAPLVTQQEIRLPLPDVPQGQEMVVYLTARDLGGGQPGTVVWQRPRIEFKSPAGAARPPILLRDVRWYAGGLERMMAAETPKTALYLRAARDLASAAGETLDDAFAQRLADLAREHRLAPRLLAHWVRVAGLSTTAVPAIEGRFTTPIAKVPGNEAISGWGSPQTPSLITNRSPDAITLGTVTFPGRGVTLHPSPTHDAYVAWRSPLRGAVRLTGKIVDTDHHCGNGVAWRVELASAAGVSRLAAGEFNNGGQQTLQLADPVAVQPGDVLSVVIAPREKNHTCDTTQVAWTLTEIDGRQRTWDLAGEVVDRVLAGNPLADAHGHDDVWHFGAIPSAAGDGATPSVAPLPFGSSLARWREAVRGDRPAEELDRLAAEVQRTLTAATVDELPAADRPLRALLLASHGPLGWADLRAGAAEAESELVGDSTYGLDPRQFGRTPDGAEIDAAALGMRASQTLEIKLPGGLAAGGELVATATLLATAGPAGGVQVAVSSSQPPTPLQMLSAPLLVAAGQAPDRLLSAVEEFRELFPPALCYARIVPVDEVVTLTLFHREDERLRRLMLDHDQAAELDRLWDELFFVAEEPIALSVAFEQIAEFATQDAPALVKALAPLRQPIFDRAEAFRQRRVATEPAHVAGVLQLADRAWRRPLSAAEQQSLRDLYGQLRVSGLDHAAAIRLLLARVLTSPAFLYKFEQPGPGATSTPVSDLELATRLSYFLWSSAPDAELRRVAEAGQLREERVLLAQTQRMLADARTRRLAVEFACQWLHVRDFDQNNDKNEHLFPEFADLRGAMYEETVRFLEDLFRHDGSVLSLLDADHSFLNEALAKHYGVAGVSGPQWRRVAGLRDQGRGGLLGMATILASQSGASRTSPILRGNWVYETLLGEKLPRPPADVPVLPDVPPEGLTERQLIERHSSVAACARCHAKIDPYGFALEQFDPIGRMRSQPVEAHTTLDDGTPLAGLAGLKQYLHSERRNDFVRQFCRKLLGFALGRETQLSDEPLLDEMQLRLAAGDFRFHLAVELIVGSRQFREIRGQSVVDE